MSEVLPCMSRSARTTLPPNTSTMAWCPRQTPSTGIRPAKARIVSMDMIRAFAGRIPVLGVCLGHQAIVEVFGGKVVRADRLMHGKTSLIRHDQRTLFEGLPQPCEVGRYHSLIAAPGRLPAQLEVSAQTAEAEIMAVRHRTLVVEGVQFHPESILTPEGPRLLGNFLKHTAGERTDQATPGAGHGARA